MLRSVWLLAATRWTSAHSASLLRFPWLSNGLSWPARSFTLAIAAALAIGVFTLWRASVRPIWTMSVITLSGPITIPVVVSVAVLITRLVAISILAFCGPWFLFPVWDVHSRLPPYGTAVNGVGVTVRVTAGEDRFFVLISHQGLPNTICIKIGRWRTKCTADTTLPWLEDTSGGKSGRHSGTLGGFKTPNSFNLATSSTVNNSRSPGKLGKIESMARKGPIVRNRTSCRVIELTSGPAWLRGMTISGNKPGPNCMPLRMRRQPPLVCSLSAGSQLGKDNSLLTTMLLVTMAYVHGLRVHVVSFWKDHWCSCSPRHMQHNMEDLCKSHVPAIVPITSCTPCILADSSCARCLRWSG